MIAGLAIRQDETLLHKDLKYEMLAHRLMLEDLFYKRVS